MITTSLKCGMSEKRENVHLEIYLQEIQTVQLTIIQLADRLDPREI